MTHLAPKAPYFVTPARVDEGPVWLITDATEQIITSAFDASLAHFVSEKLNHRCDDKFNSPMHINPLVATMLCAFRLHLEHEHGGPLVDEPDVPLLMADLCDWFGFNTGERAMALGPDWLAYLARLDGEMPDVDDQMVALGWPRSDRDCANRDVTIIEVVHGCQPSRAEVEDTPVIKVLQGERRSTIERGG